MDAQCDPVQTNQRDQNRFGLLPEMQLKYEMRLLFPACRDSCRP